MEADEEAQKKKDAKEQRRLKREQRKEREGVLYDSD